MLRLVSCPGPGDRGDGGNRRALGNSGDIAFHLHRYTESRDAYWHAAALSDAGYFAGDIRLKAGYALTRTKELTQAADFFSLRVGEDCRAVACEGGPLTRPSEDCRAVACGGGPLTRPSEDCRAVALAKAGFSIAPAKTAAP